MSTISVCYNPLVSFKKMLKYIVPIIEIPAKIKKVEKVPKALYKVGYSSPIIKEDT